MGFSLTPESCSWQNVEFTLAELALSLPTIKKIDFGSSVDIVAQYGSGNKLYGYTAGIIKPEPVKIEIAQTDWAVLFTALVLFAQAQPETIAGGLFFTGFNGMDLIYSPGCAFHVNVSFQMIKNFVVQTATLKNCRITKFSEAPAQGPEGIMVSLEMVTEDLQFSSVV